MNHPLLNDTMISSETTQSRSGIPSRDQDVSPMLVDLRDGNGAEPLFCIHHSGGDVGIYRKLATRMKPGRSVIGIQSRLESGAATEYSSLATMASAYATLITERQVRGDVHLLGFSFGGFVATLIADRLRNAGRKVRFLGLIDSNLGWVDANDSSRMELRIRLMQLFEKFQSVGVMNFKPQDVMQRDVTKLVDACLDSDEVRPAAIMEKTTSMGYVPAGGTYAKMLGDFTYKFITHCRLLRGFKPCPIKESLHLWWPSDVQELESGAAKWSDFAFSQVTETTIEGSHYSIMRMPTARMLARQIDVALSRTGEKERHPELVIGDNS